jgi:hypothetical protein
LNIKCPFVSIYHIFYSLHRDIPLLDSSADEIIVYLWRETFRINSLLSQRSSTCLLGLSVGALNCYERNGRLNIRHFFAIECLSTFFSINAVYRMLNPALQTLISLVMDMVQVTASGSGTVTQSYRKACVN